MLWGFWMQGSQGMSQDHTAALAGRPRHFSALPPRQTGLALVSGTLPEMQLHERFHHNDESLKLIVKIAGNQSAGSEEFDKFKSVYINLAEIRGEQRDGIALPPDGCGREPVSGIQFCGAASHFLRSKQGARVDRTPVAAR